MDIFAQIAEKIIEEQERIIGPIAIEEAERVQGLKVDWKKHETRLEGSPKDIIEKLIEQYRDFFGQASVEVCKEAVRGLVKNIPPEQLPKLLR